MTISGPSQKVGYRECLACGEMLRAQSIDGYCSSCVRLGHLSPVFLENTEEVYKFENYSLCDECETPVFTKHLGDDGKCPECFWRDEDNLQDLIGRASECKQCQTIYDVSFLEQGFCHKCRSKTPRGVAACVDCGSIMRGAFGFDSPKCEYCRYYGDCKRCSKTMTKDDFHLKGTCRDCFFEAQQEEEEDTIKNEEGGRQSYIPRRFDLIPTKALFEVAKVLHEGEVKYEEGNDEDRKNWEKITPESHLNHALNHIYEHLDGDDAEEHLSHAICRLFFALDIENRRV